jgi:hypothetical protein
MWATASLAYGSVATVIVYRCRLKKVVTQPGFLPPDTGSLDLLSASDHRRWIAQYGDGSDASEHGEYSAKDNRRFGSLGQ